MKPRVLIVDDEPAFVRQLESNLVPEGFEVVSAAYGMEALHKARRAMPDVIVLATMLPDLDGLAVREILQLQPSTKDVPVILLGPRDRAVAPERGGEAGVPCCFTKAMDFRLLTERVRTAFEEGQECVRARLAEEELATRCLALAVD